MRSLGRVQADASANKDHLQSKGTTINQLGLKYYLGEFQGFYFGILYSHEHSKCLQFTTDSRPFGEFFSDLTGRSIFLLSIE